MLSKSREKFQEDKYIHLEQWSSQPDPNVTVFQNTLVWVQLPDLRDECVEMVEDIVAAVGELVIRPSEEELWDKKNLPKFGVRVSSLKGLPYRVDIVTEEDEEDIR